MLPNGLTVLYRQDAAFPLVSATLLFRQGSREEHKNQAGLSSMTIDLLMQGTRRRNARQIARVTEAVGASIGTQAHEDYTEVGFVAPAAETGTVLDLTAEVLTEPSFPREELAKEKAHVLADLSSRHDAIFNVAYDEVNERLYGEHPYSWPLEGRASAVKRFKRADIQEWHDHHIRPHGTILSMIGPMPAKEAAHAIEKHLKNWGAARRPRSGQSRKDPAPINLPLRHGEVVVPSKFEQAYFMLAWPAPRASSPDHLPLKVLNTLLGGGMSSRLFVTLREKWGLAYEVSSFYPTRLDTSHWVIYLGLPAEKLSIAAKKLNELLDQMVRHSPAAHEVTQAKAMIRGAFLMDRQSRRRQAWYAAWWEFLGRDPDDGTTFLKAVDAVTPEDLHKVAKRLLEQHRVTVKVIPK
jgi:predicted Zn-dependent peptidase